MMRLGRSWLRRRGGERLWRPWLARRTSTTGIEEEGSAAAAIKRDALTTLWGAKASRSVKWDAASSVPPLTFGRAAERYDVLSQALSIGSGSTGEPPEYHPGAFHA